MDSRGHRDDGLEANLKTRVRKELGKMDISKKFLTIVDDTGNKIQDGKNL